MMAMATTATTTAMAGATTFDVLVTPMAFCVPSLIFQYNFGSPRLSHRSATALTTPALLVYASVALDKHI
jgi:hypothetical protein